MRRLATRLALVVVLGCMAFGALGWLEGFATRRAIEEENQRAQASVILLESSFKRELEKFRMASVVLARDPDALVALNSKTPNSVAYLNTKFEALSKDMQAASIYLLDETGFAIAASNWREPTSFVGTSYSFRAYYQRALTDGQHEQFALGNVSRRPGLYISRRIDEGGKVKGFVVIKVEFDRLEAEWKGYGKPAFVTNGMGVVLVTSIPQWRFMSVGPLSESDQKQAALSRDFGKGDIRQIPLFAENKVGRASLGDGIVPSFVEAVKEPTPDWTVHVLSNTSDGIRRGVNRSRLLVLGTLLLLGAIIIIDMYRRRVVLARAELASSERMRDLTDRLAHANRLSILGQIAAGVGHEINQPLAAIGTYAATGVALLDKGGTASVKDNLERIGKLVGRIGDITSELRTFARKSPRRLEIVNVGRAIDAALLLLEDRIATSKAVISVTRPNDDLLTMAYQGGLEQVMVNLLQNALDACGNGAQIQVNLSQSPDWIEITVTDNGPGLSDTALEGLFQPFLTSKPDGLGLGLVISRDLISEFNGEIRGTNDKSGCTFTVNLPAIRSTQSEQAL